MTRPVYASIDLDALKHNYSRAKELAPSSKIMAIVKADAYGHDIALCCAALADADSIGLLDLSDAITLRESGYLNPICLLEGFFSADELLRIAQHQIDVVIHSEWQIDSLDLFDQQAKLNVWLKADTGMGRLGFSANEFSFALDRLNTIQCVNEVKLISHLANADREDSSKTEQQLSHFLKLSDETNHQLSLSNSAAVLAHPSCHLDWVRPGIMLYGSSPFTHISAAELKLEPVMSLNSEIIAVRYCNKGDQVGYGGQWTCPEDMRIGVIACGYGDGYPRHAPNGTPIFVEGIETQLIGRVSMDMITVDLRGLVTVKAGSKVELWGKNLSVDDIAKISGTISYELLCGITQRVKRQEVTDG